MQFILIHVSHPWYRDNWQLVGACVTEGKELAKVLDSNKE